MNEEALVSQSYGDSSSATGGEELSSWESTGQYAAEEAGTWGGEQQEAGEEPIYEIDGKSYRLSELRELVKSGMLERDYRIKTAELAEERRQIEQLRQAAEAWMALQQYPELVELLRNKVVEMLSGAGQGREQQVAATQQEAGFEEPWQREIAMLRQQLASLAADYQQRVQAYQNYMWQQYYSQRASYAQSQLPSLREKYPFLYEEEVIAAFVQNPNTNLEELAKASHEHWYQFYRDREKGAVQKRVENAKARVAVPAARAGGAAGKVPSAPASFDDARRAALERLAQAGLFAKR